MFTVILHHVKETKNTHRFDYTGPEEETPAITSVYVAKAAFVGPAPKSIKVSCEVYS